MRSVKRPRVEREVFDIRSMDRGNVRVLNPPLIPVHLIVAASAWGSRVVAAAAQLLVIRALLPYLGAQGYALFSVVTSLATWFSLVEFGVGYSLQNRISVSRAAGGERDVLIRSTFPLLGGLFAISVLVLAVAGPALQRFLFRRMTDAPAASGPSYVVAAVGLVYIITSLAGISYKIFYGEMRGYLSNFYVVAANVLGLLAVLVIRKLELANHQLEWALAAWTLPPAIVALVAAIHIYNWHRLSRASVDWEFTRQLWSRAWRFGGYALLMAAVLGVDYVVMSQTLPADQIVRYNAIAKVYGLIFFICTALFQATWPVCAEAFGRGDTGLVRKLMRDGLLAGGGVVIGGTLVLMVSRDAVSAALLGDHHIDLPVPLIAAFGVYFLLRVWTEAFTTILMSRDRLRIFWLYVPFQAAISAIAQVVLSKRFGVYGILAGLIVSFLCTSVWVLPLEYLRLCRSADIST